ncbi:hypothetical protein BP5796_02001 [Coleophoma crateriformis]|uniref:Zn(2)-C6 fungal-type domain-containing protein n=1 Tax=Coleophoma crateriformis TaxID=565419 RepID=A0A3D8T203_9HELO|nr:hypothetical protein BP5796_02001 [Coleophoma crateriformis]
MASTPTETAGKRKRSPSHAQQMPTPQMSSSQAGNANGYPQVDYLAQGTKRLKLIEGDSDTFRDVLGMIDDYESVLQRHESLASNLGAKLVGPLLLKTFDKLFDGEIRVVDASLAMQQTPPTWLELVNFARTNANDFVLNEHGYCQVFIGGGQVQISEDDYRLIMSGAPERMIPNQPIPEDEAAELGTLNILEARLQVLIKKADVVASKARQLNYHLGKHKLAVQARASVSSASGPPPNGNLTLLQVQQDLLKQFSQDGRQSPLPLKTIRPHHATVEDRRSMSSIAPDHRRESPSDKDNHRSLMTARIEKLSRGEPIDPPCDRCRRLKFECTKNLTACGACTKKHAKCSWADITEEELATAQAAGRGSSVSDPADLDPLLAATGTTHTNLKGPF